MTPDETDLTLVLAHEYRLVGRIDLAERSVTRALAQLRGMSYSAARFEVRRARVEMERMLAEIDDEPA